MKNIRYIIVLFALVVLAGCEEEILFDTVEAPNPTVTDEGWTASGGGVTTGFSEGGRSFRLPNPLDEDNPYRDIQFSVTINSNDGRVIDSLAIEFQHVPSLPSNSPQGWSFIEGIKLDDAEKSDSYNFTYNMNFDDVSEIYWDPGDFFIATGAFGIIREDNVVRIGVFFEDGSSFRIAQVQFSYALTEDGEE